MNRRFGNTGKIGALALAILLVLTAFAPTQVVAATTYVITGINDKPLKSDRTLENLTVSSESSVYFSIDPSYFTWENDNAPKSLTNQILQENGVGVATTIPSEYVREPSLLTYYFRLRFTEPPNLDIGINTFDFSGAVYLTWNGNDFAETALEGTLYAYKSDGDKHIIFIDKDDDYVDLSGGSFAFPLTDIDNIEADVGNSIYVHTFMEMGQEYYGTTSTSITGEDAVLYDARPEIIDIITLDVSSNLKSGYVSFNNYGDYYIYGPTVDTWLGKSNDILPYCDKYYVTSAKAGTSVPNNKYTVTYHANGADGGDVPVDPNFYRYGQKVEILSPDYNYDELYKSGCEFVGWNTKADGSGIMYREYYEWFWTTFGSFIMGDADVDLYAIWADATEPEWRYLIYDMNKPLAIDGSSEVENLQINGGDTVKIKLDPSYFTWWDEQPDQLSLALLEKNDVVAKTSIRQGSRVLESVSLEESQQDGVYIAINFSENVSSLDFDISVYLVIDRTRYSAYEIRLSGIVAFVDPGIGDSRITAVKVNPLSRDADIYKDFDNTGYVSSMFLPSDFTWTNGERPLNSLQLFTDAKIGVGYTTPAGMTDYISSIEIIRGTQGCFLAINYNTPSIFGLYPFKNTIYLTQNGVKIPDTSVDIGGRLVGQSDDVGTIVYPGDTYVYYLYGGAASFEDIPSILMDLGCGFLMRSPMKAGEIYKGEAVNGLDNKDRVLKAQYPQIVDVFTLTDVSANLQATGKAVFEGYHGFHVYGPTINDYLGTTEDDIPYCAKYYLAAKKLDSAEAVGKYEMFYNGSGYTGGIPPRDAKTYYAGQRVDLVYPANMSKTGYVFAGWKTVPGEGGERYYLRSSSHIYTASGDYTVIGWIAISNGAATVPLQTHVTMGNSDITMYAIWRQITGFTEKQLVCKDLVSTKNVNISSGTILQIPIDSSNFKWASTDKPLNLALLSENDVFVRMNQSNAVKDVRFEEKMGQVYIAIEFESSKTAIPFDFGVRLTQLGGYSSVSYLNFTGTLNPLTTSDGNGTDSGDGGGNSGGGGKGGGGKGGGGGGGGGGAIPAVDPLTPAPVKGAVNVGDVTNVVQKALATAKTSGASSAIVKFKNMGGFSLEAAQVMVKATGSTPLRVYADSTLNNGSVDVRLSFNPAQMEKNIDLSASTSSDRANSIKTFFKKWYDNKIQVISCAQQGNFGMPVDIIIKLDKDLNSKTLLFYSYDKDTNSYKAIENTKYWVDKNGYVHFTTTLAGDIIIMDKAFKRK